MRARPTAAPSLGFPHPHSPARRLGSSSHSILPPRLPWPTLSCPLALREARGPGPSDTPPDLGSPETAQLQSFGLSPQTLTAEHHTAVTHMLTDAARVASPAPTLRHLCSGTHTHLHRSHLRGLQRKSQSHEDSRAPPRSVTHKQLQTHTHTGTHPGTSAEAALCERDRRTDWQTDNAPASQPGEGVSVTRGLG